MPIALVLVLTLLQSASPFVGTWIADLSRSKQHPGYEFQSVTVEFAVAGNTVTITDRHVYVDGKETGGVHTFEADGKERPFDAAAIGTGVTLVATPHCLTNFRCCDTNGLSGPLSHLDLPVVKFLFAPDSLVPAVGG